MENKNFKKLGGEFIENLGEYVREYVRNHPGVSVYIGCDSDEVNASTLCYVSTICFYDELRKDGVHYIFSREFVDSRRKLITRTGDVKEDKKKVKEAKQDNIFNKIWGEVERLAQKMSLCCTRDPTVGGHLQRTRPTVGSVALDGSDDPDGEF